MTSDFDFVKYYYVRHLNSTSFEKRAFNEFHAKEAKSEFIEGEGIHRIAGLELINKFNKMNINNVFWIF